MMYVSFYEAMRVALTARTSKGSSYKVVRVAHGSEAVFLVVKM